jgi:hypothetical protein
MFLVFCKPRSMAILDQLITNPTPIGECLGTRES